MENGLITRITDWLRASPAELGVVALLGALVVGGAAFAYVRSAEPPPAPVRVHSHEASPSPEAKLLVHVSGHVTSPGVYELDPGGRVKDAVAAAGGALEGADLNALNLAAPIGDGEKVVVPAPGAQGAGTSDAGAELASGKVNLNTATKEQLEELPSVGPVLAQRIIDHRTKKRFTSTRQLMDVEGFGQKKYDSLKDKITV